MKTTVLESLSNKFGGLQAFFKNTCFEEHLPTGASVKPV